MLKIGITGSIGVGKTTISKIFETLGIPVFYADIESKRFLLHDTKVRSMLVKEFGKGVLNEQNNIHIPYLSKIVFNDPSKLEVLGHILHPLVNDKFDQWASSKKEAPYVLKEAALFFEAGSHKFLDFIIGVICSDVERKKRIQKRDGSTTDEIEKKIKLQLPNSLKVKLCDGVIFNNGKKLLVPQVLKYHKKFLEMSKGSSKSLLLQ